MALYDAESTSIIVSDGSVDNGSGLAVTVDPAVLDHFTWGPQPDGTQTAGSAFTQTVTVTAYDAYGNVATNYDGNTSQPSRE